MEANRSSDIDDDAASSKRELRGIGYKSFVAWRYLLVTEPKVTRLTKQLLVAGCGVLIASLVAVGLGIGGEDARDVLLAVAKSASLYIAAVTFWGVLRHSRPAMITFSIGIMLIVAGATGSALIRYNKVPIEVLDSTRWTTALQVLNIVGICGLLLGFLAMFFGFLRAFFTFFTTVPIGGVWIGTTALVWVLAVMSGFESDLREKIVGSNAHLQITRQEGEFEEWREVKAKLDQMPGVVASTPFAVSEVVIAANNTGQNVIIKGIDPKTVGKVTDLVSDLDDREAMNRLDPIVADARDLRVPQKPRTDRAPGSAPVIDPPPDDMPTPGEPIDYSGDHAVPDPGDSAAGTARAGGKAGQRPGSKADGLPLFGGDAREIVGEDAADTADPPRPVIDPPPRDLITPDEPPTDYSRPDYLPETVVKVIDVPFDTPSLSRRTQALPGILVGRELVKQTHLYTGEEVRIVSPLSDPANPDATGTPIPFNRDYRVAGIFYTGMYEYDLKYVYVTLDSLQDFLDRGDSVDGIEVRTNNPDDTDAFVARFRATLGPQYRIQDWKELNRSLFSALKLEKIAMFLVLGIVIMVASFSIVGNLIMVVQGKVRQIALLKTLGASDVGVLQLFAIQGLMIGLIGTVLGISTGLLACWMSKRFGLPLNADVYYIDRLPIHVDPMSVVATASVGILISIAATLYPAVIAARVRPAAGLRH